MKKLLAVVMGAFLLFTLSSCGAKNPIEYKKIDYEISQKGVLKTSITTSFSDDEISRRKDEFIDEDGLVLFEYLYSYDEHSNEWDIYRYIYNTYNSSNLLISSIETRSGEDTITTYNYDSNKNLISEISDGPRYHFKCVYEYDESNNLISEQSYISNNGGVSWDSNILCKYTYEKNKLIKKERLYSYNDDWKKDSLEENKYDESNKLVETIFYEASDDGKKYNEDRKTKYKYDEKNNLVKETEYNRGNKYWSLQKWNEKFKIKYKYDENNNLVSMDEYKVSIWETKVYTKTNYYYTYYE